MKHSSTGRPTGRRTISTAQRGRIVQCVIVGGWTAAKAAAEFDLPERLVKVWVADYRRHGMASLRHVPRRTMAEEIVQRRLLWPVSVTWRRLRNGVRRLFARRPRVEPAALRRINDDRGGSTPSGG